MIERPEDDVRKEVPGPEDFRRIHGYDIEDDAEPDESKDEPAPKGDSETG